MWKIRQDERQAMTVNELRKALEPFAPNAQVLLGGARFYEAQEVQRANQTDEDEWSEQDGARVRKGDAVLVFWTKP